MQNSKKQLGLANKDYWRPLQKLLQEFHVNEGENPIGVAEKTVGNEEMEMWIIKTLWRNFDEK